jgi:hypothetical protein
MEVILYERRGCHLCDEVRVLLDDMLGSDRYLRIDVDGSDDLVLRYGFRVPVIATNGTDRLEAPMTADDVRALVGSLERAR